MDKEQIRQRLADNGLDKYIQVFEDNHLFDEAVLRTLTDDDYISVGVTILGDRRKLQLLFSGEQGEAASPDDGHELVNISKNGREYCIRPSEPSALMCRRCHARVSEDSTMCWSCNNSLVEQDAPPPYGRSQQEDAQQDDGGGHAPPKPSVKGKITVFAIISVMVAALTYTCVISSGGGGKGTSGGGSSSSRYSTELTGVSVSLSPAQIKITTSQTLHNVRIRVNHSYTYEVRTMSPGTYTAGLATFADSRGNRFSPGTQKVTGVGIFSDEGSTYFTP